MHQRYSFIIVIYIKELPEKVLNCFQNRIQTENHHDAEQVICCICRSKEDLDVCLYAERGAFRILLTDSEEAAGRYHASDIVCIGYQQDASDFFAGAALVTESLKNLDLQTMIEVCLHEKHLPVTIARTDHLMLREMKRADIPFLCSMSNAEGMDVGLLDRLTGENSFSEENLVAYMENAYRFYGYGLWITVWEEEQGETLMGCCGFGNWDCGEETERLELQYALMPEFRGQGHAQKMCRLALRYLFEQMDEAEVWLRIRPENYRSIRLAEKLGFEKQETNEFYLIYLRRQQNMTNELA